MVTVALLAVACILPPSPEKDTATYRLKVYSQKPKAEFCYNWHPDVETRRTRWVFERMLQRRKPAVPVRVTR